MEGFKDPIWYEDIERHRQPSLYYLSSEDDPAGPHLICDWNGAPTNFKEFDIDLLSKFIEVDPEKETKGDKEPELQECFSKPTHSMTTSYTKSRKIHAETNDNSQFGFLTVPPLVNSLLKRLYMDHVEDKIHKRKNGRKAQDEVLSSKKRLKQHPKG